MEGSVLKVRKKSVLHPRGQWFKGDVTKKANRCGRIDELGTMKNEEDQKHGITGFTI